MWRSLFSNDKIYNKKNKLNVVSKLIYEILNENQDPVGSLNETELSILQNGRLAHYAKDLINLHAVLKLHA